MLYTNKDLKRLIIPLIFEQLLAILVGMVDTVMIAGVGGGGGFPQCLLCGAYLLAKQGGHADGDLSSPDGDAGAGSEGIFHGFQPSSGTVSGQERV